VHKAVAGKCGLSSTSTLAELAAAANKQAVRLVTATEGNWGRAVARMARYLQIDATIFVPDFMDEATQTKIRSEGAKVIVVDGDYDRAISYAKQDADEGGLLVIDVSWEGYEEVPEVMLQPRTRSQIADKRSG
jgi:diaminopropionate ammonia-lyase